MFSSHLAFFARLLQLKALVDVNAGNQEVTETKEFIINLITSIFIIIIFVIIIITESLQGSLPLQSQDRRHSHEYHHDHLCQLDHDHHLEIMVIITESLPDSPPLQKSQDHHRTQSCQLC